MLTFEAVSALFMFRKFIDGVRYIRKVNTILNVIHLATTKIMLFLAFSIFVWGASLIMAQGIYGQYYYSFKHLDHSMNEIGMMFFG